MLLKAIIIALGCSALALKALSIAPPPVAADLLLDQLTHKLEQRGMLETGRASLTSEGTYRVARYATLSCREALIVMPLLRNGEFKGLIAAPRFPIHYIINGETYDDLPAARLWIETLKTRIGISTAAIPPIAIVADPTCLPDFNSVLH